MMASILRHIRLEPASATFAKGSNAISSNKGLDPVPRDSPERKWRWPSLVGFWIAEAFNISMYQVASTSITKGLTPGLAVAAVFIGHLLVSIPAMLNAYIGATYGLNFPGIVRSCFGIYGAYFVVFIRGVVATIWFGTQSYQGGQCVQSMLEAIWPSFKSFPNHIPESSHVTSAQLLCFFLFIIFQLPLLGIRVSSLRWLFQIKLVIMPIFGLTLFIWAVIEAKGFGPTFNKPTHITDGTPAAVVFFQCITAAISAKAPLVLSIPDFTRYAVHPKQVFWTHILGLGVIVSLCGLLGATVTSACETIYGVSTWNPLQVADLWNNRAAKFFAALCWGFAIVGTNISANSVSFANDLSLWFPRWVNVRRGSYICAVVSVAATPWNIQNSAKSFSAFLGGYPLFLGPIAGIMITDYYLLRKQTINLVALYHHPSLYSFFHGFNLRAFVAFFLALVPNLPGLAQATGQSGVPKGAGYLYSLSWLVGIVLSVGLYYVLGRLWPMEDVHDESDSVEGVDVEEEGYRVTYEDKLEGEKL